MSKPIRKMSRGRAVISADETQLWAWTKDENCEIAKGELAFRYRKMLHREASIFAHRFNARRLTADLESACGEGLIRAIEAYDPSTNNSFSAFAASVMFCKMQNAITYALRNKRTFCRASLDAPLGENSDSTLGSLQIDPRAPVPGEASEKNEAYVTIIDKLPRDARHVLRLRFFEDMTFEEIAAQFRVRHQDIHSLSAKAIDTIAANHSADELQELLGGG